MVGRILSDVQGKVAFVTIENDRKLNALDVVMWRSLRAQFEELSRRDELRCIVIRGAGEKAFSAGADISEFAATRSNREQVTRFHEEIVGPALMAIFDCDVPVVAQIRGVCMGGGLEIACACDLRLADDSARFGAPVGKLGFPLAFAETQSLFALVGWATSAELLIEGRILSAADAFDRRLVTRVSRSVELEDDVARCVKSICESGRWAAQSHKQQLRRLVRDSSPVSAAERHSVYAFADTDEYQEGYRRFVRKQKPAPRG